MGSLRLEARPARNMSGATGAFGEARRHMREQRLSQGHYLASWRARSAYWKRSPVVLAPRGEFSAGASQIRPGRKRIVLTLASHAGLLHGLLWQASTEAERLPDRASATCLAMPASTWFDISPRQPRHEPPASHGLPT